MSWYGIDTWIVVIGALCAVACALPGCFLVLRQMSMMGDAISHAVLPGLAIAFLLTGSRASVEMFIGAAIVGVLTAVFTQWVSSFGQVDRGASMGIVFTTLFAVGLLLIVQAADHVDLDPGCVLYGAIELTPLDTVTIPAIGPWTLNLGVGEWSLGQWTVHVMDAPVDVPRAAVVLGAVLLANLLIVVLLFKELRISSFDPELATTLGINATLMHYLLMTMVAVTTVASFEAVGSIIVIAMLIVPAATAYLLTNRLAVMIVISTVVAAGSAGLGHLAALTVPGWITFSKTTPAGESVTVEFDSTTTSGMMALAAGGLFVLAWLFGPEHGLIGRRLRHRHADDETEPAAAQSPDAESDSASDAALGSAG